ncbi:MAG: hypothetical protein QOH41_2497 [Blastocatellia bacterium]|jgi:hypothetical protein|nr:hypothetical protein [Blastocatellia bacterium]
MRQLQLMAHGEPSEVIELNTVSESALGQEDVHSGRSSLDSTQHKMD